MAPPAVAPAEPCCPRRGTEGAELVLRRAVRRYRAPVADALEAGGFGDLPQQGIWAVVRSAQSKPGMSGRDLVTRMGISKQAVSQLVETFVTLGYVGRDAAADDRRRTLLLLTTRGRRAAWMIDATVAEMEETMASTIGRERL